MAVSSQSVQEALNLQEGSSATTYPTIQIKTINYGSLAAVKQNNIIINFSYLPESISMGVSAQYNATPFTFSAAKWLIYDHSDIEDISLTVKVVAGLNNAVYSMGANITGGSFSPVVAKKRVDLITLAKFLYAFCLPGDNQYPSTPPAASQLIVGNFCNVAGAFKSMHITFNGPYDYDSSPTDMTVDMSFIASEFYNSSQPGTSIGTAGADYAGKPDSIAQETGAQGQFSPSKTMSAYTEISDVYPWAIVVGSNIAPVTIATQQTIDGKWSAAEAAEQRARDYIQGGGDFTQNIPTPPGHRDLGNVGTLPPRLRYRK